MIPELTAQESARYETLVFLAKQEAAPSAVVAEGEYIDRAIKKLETKGLSPQEAWAAAQMRLGARTDRGTLHPQDTLCFQRDGEASVATILTDPKRYHGQYCSDPTEPEEGNSKACLFANGDGSVILFSQLHGGQNFYLRRVGETLSPDSTAEEPSFIWKNAGKDSLGHAKKYFASRALNLDPLPVCFKWNSYTDKQGQEQNMIVAAASCPEDTQVYAVQRLFIDLEDHKKTGAKMHGPCDGRGVWFNRQGDKTEIVIGEGIETVLSAIQAWGRNGVAALSTSGMKGLIIPDETHTIYILVDSDPVRDGKNSMPGQTAAVELAGRFAESRDGRVAWLVSPDDSRFGEKPAKLDFNDLLQADPSGENIRKRFAKAVRLEDLVWEKAEAVDGGEGDDSGYYPPETLEALQEMNKTFAAVMMGGDFRVLREGLDNIAKRHTISFIKSYSFCAYHANVRVVVGDVEPQSKELAKVWMSWLGRRQYSDLVFDPSGQAPATAYNLFRGFSRQPQEGDCSLIKQHIFEVICDGNIEYYNYTMAWMARIVQKPGGQRPGVAIVLKGNKGTGKGQFVDYFGDIFGEAFLPIADSESFTGRFNMHLSKALLVFLDEAVWGGDKRAEGKMKQIITESTILFEPKGIDAITMRNYINAIIASNEEWVVPATGDERRYFVLKVSDKRRQDTAYFDALRHERENGGVEAFMYDLLQYDIGQVNLRHAPDTEGLSEQVCESLPSVLEFWHSVLERGYILSDRETGEPARSKAADVFETNHLWPGFVFKHEVFNEYENWARKRNERYPRNSVHFWRETGRFYPLALKEIKRPDQGGAKLRAIKLPDVVEVRAMFTLHTKIQFKEGFVEDGMEPWANQF